MVGAGSAGCAAAWALAEANIGTVAVLEAGPSDAHPFVKVPFALIWLMNSRRDWRRKTVPMQSAGGRQIKVPRGRMLGGSGSINSMVWFRGRRADFDAWEMPGWSGAEVWETFEAVEARLTPATHPDPHALSRDFARALGSNGAAPPRPDFESAGVFESNMRGGRRWSAADAYLRPAQTTGRVEVLTGAQVDRVAFEEGQARSVHLADGRVVRARAGIVLSAGAIESPAILMRSGIGQGAHLQDLGVEVQHDLPGVGQNLHDHPAVGVHHAGPRGGYGLSWRQLPAWGLSPVNWLLRRKGRLTSNVVEAGAFFRVSEGDGPPECQVHFIPAKLGWQGRATTWGEGYYADVCLCRPLSRGALRLVSSDPRAGPAIDLGLFREESDLDMLARGFRRLRHLMAEAPFSERLPEMYPGAALGDDLEALKAQVRASAGTAYHPVGTCAMGEVVDAGLKVAGLQGLWVADASVMPKITSANTNAPSMMIGHLGGERIAAAHRP